MKNEKNRKLHGSVLLTVVVVMSLLIVFLFGTLALATAANNRAHVNYSSSQTGVTSRMVAQSAVEAMDASLTYRQVIGNITAGSPEDINVTIGNASTFNAGALGDIAPVRVEYAGTKKVYDYSENTWKDNDILKFTSTVTMGGVESKTSAYVLKLTTTGGGDPPNPGSGFRTTGQATVECQTSLYGGTYINLPKDSYKYYEEMVGGSPRKPNFSGKPATKLNNSGAIAEAPLFINNNVYVENWSGFLFAERSEGITIWGDLEYSNNVKDSDKCQFEAKDGIDFTNLKFKDIPYLYVDGQIKYGNALKLGNVSKPFPLNVFCGSLNCSDGNGAGCIEIAANIYCMNEGETSYITAMNLSDSKLYSWTESVVNQAVSSIAQPNKTSIYSKGNLVLKNLHIDGDVSCDGDCEIIKDITIDGNLYVGGHLKVNGDANLTVNGEIVCKTHEGDLKKEPASANKQTIKAGYEKINTFYHDGKVDMTTSIQVENKEIPYLVFNSGNYFEPDTIDYTNPYDEAIADNATVRIYSWRTDLTPTEISGILALAKETEDKINALDITDPDYQFNVRECWREFYNVAASYIIKDSWLDEYPAGKSTYTVKSYYDPATTNITYGSVPVSEQYSYYDLATGIEVKDGEPYRTLPTWNPGGNNYVDGGEKTTLEYVYASKTNPGVWVGEDEAVKSADYYPQYADREVLLGISQVENPSGGGKLSKESTRVVQTIDYLYTVKNLDPYAASVSGLPAEFTGTYSGIKTYNLSNGDDVNKLIAESGNSYVKSIGGAGDALYAVELDNKADRSNMSGLYINKSCRLTGSYGSDGKDVIIDPNGTNLLVAFGDCSFGAGCDIIIDDSKGGKVTFFIEDNAKLTFSGEALYATISYMNLLKHFNGKPLQLVSKYYVDPLTSANVKDSNYSTADPATSVPYFDITEDITDGDLTWLKSRFVPSFDIRSGENSTLEISNFKLLTANIVSSGLDFKLNATSTMPFKPSAFYYNGTNIYKPMTNGTTDTDQIIFGCVNTAEATIPNKVQVIFADNGGGSSGVPPATGDFDYSILYYDEY